MPPLLYVLYVCFLGIKTCDAYKPATVKLVVGIGWPILIEMWFLSDSIACVPEQRNVRICGFLEVVAGV